MGFELAFPGSRAVCVVEREAFAVAHLVAAMRAGLMAPAPVWSDARTLDGRRWRGQVDFVIGGIPCQPHSLAGKRLGRDDPRDLWSAFRRILVQSGAWGCVVENVPGMLSSGGAERVWRDLHRLGFAVEAGLFSAEEVGASHGRERLFVLGIHRGRMADADRAGFEKRRRPVAIRPQHAAAECGERAMGDAAGERRGEGRAEPELRCGRGAAGRDGEQVADAGCGKGEQRCRADEIWRWSGKAEQAGLGSGELVDTDRSRWSQAGIGHAFDARCQSVEGCGALADNPRGGVRGVSIQSGRPEQAGSDPDGSGAGLWPLFAPGPGDELWRAVAEFDPLRLPALSRHDLFLHACRDAGVDPHGHSRRAGRAAARVHAAQLSEITQRTLRGMAHGVAGPLGPDRIDALRLLGNGVVPLAAGYALRTLWHAHAARDGRCADRSVRVSA